MLMMLSRIRFNYLRIVLLLAWLPIEVMQFALFALKHGALFESGPWKRGCMVYVAAMNGAFINADKLKEEARLLGKR